MKLNKAIQTNWALLAVNNKLEQLRRSIMGEVIKDIEQNGNGYHPNSWTAHALNFVRMLTVGDPSKIVPYFKLFKEGNSKLPFLSWSTLPGVNCPGAGPCLIWCYSFKAWRYPAAYFRQLQNTILERNAPGVIAAELDKILSTKKYEARRVDLRLYVDGDFPNLSIMQDWFQLLEDRPRVAAYGYSKSLPMFHQYVARYGHVPGNYALNASQGGKHDNLFKSLEKYDFFRGTFETVDIGKKIAAHKMTNEDKRKARKAAGSRKVTDSRKVFICPGPCGSCTSAGHACGNLEVFKNTRIITPIH